MIDDIRTDSKPGENVPEPGTVDPAGDSGTFASLRILNFRWLFTGSIFANGAQWVQQVILSWLVYNITGSGTILGSISMTSSAASFGMIFGTGALVDFFDRRKLMALETAIMFAVTLVLGFLLLGGHSNISFLFIFAFIAGLFQTLDMTLRQVLVFDIVPRAETPGAMAIVQTGWSLMRVLGPSLGGFMLLWFGAGGSFLAQAGAYALIVLTVVRMKLPERKKDAVQASPLQNIRDGIEYVAKERVTLLFTLIGIVMPILIIPVFMILPPIYAVRVFGDPSGKILGFLMASVGVGGFIGGIVLNYLRRWEYWGRLQLISLLFLSVALIGFAYSSSLPVALLLLVVAGFFEIIFLTTNQTLIQLSISDKLRGRVTAVISLTWILSPVGNLIAGAGSDLMGGPKPITIILASVAIVTVIAIIILSPTVRNYRLSQGIKSG